VLVLVGGLLQPRRDRAPVGHVDAGTREQQTHHRALDELEAQHVARNGDEVQLVHWDVTAGRARRFLLRRYERREPLQRHLLEAVSPLRREEVGEAHADDAGGAEVLDVRSVVRVAFVDDIQAVRATHVLLTHVRAVEAFRPARGRGERLGEPLSVGLVRVWSVRVEGQLRRGGATTAAMSSDLDIRAGDAVLAVLPH
jgi:hypothetical protein